MKKLLLILMLCSPLIAQITGGTTVVKNQTPAATTGTSGATLSVASGGVILCGVVTDDNGTNTSVSSIVVSGSPTYSIAWQQVPSCGRVINANLLNTELWYAVPSSTITTQTIQATISSSELFGFVCRPFTGVDSANPIPNCNQANTTATVGTLTTPSIPYNGSGTSFYVGWLGVGSNNNTNVAPNASYTQNGAINDAAGTALWVHGLFETITTGVTSAQTVNATFTTNVGANAASIIGVELKQAGGAPADLGVSKWDKYQKYDDQ